MKNMLLNCFEQLNKKEWIMSRKSNKPSKNVGASEHENQSHITHIINKNNNCEKILENIIDIEAVLSFTNDTYIPIVNACLTHLVVDKEKSLNAITKMA
jgi:acetolactate synthase small subunit